MSFILENKLHSNFGFWGLPAFCLCRLHLTSSFMSLMILFVFQVLENVLTIWEVMPRINNITMNKKTIINLKGDLFLFRFSFLANQFLYGKKIYYLKLNYRIQKSSLKSWMWSVFCMKRLEKKVLRQNKLSDSQKDIVCFTIMILLLLFKAF